MEATHVELKKICHIKFNEPLSKHSTFKVGGPAKYFCEPESTEELARLVKFFSERGVDFLVIGQGSNTLFSDEGFDGAVVSFRAKKIEILDSAAPPSGANEQILIKAQSGALTAEVARKSLEAGGEGFEWGAGIPGTIGGAVFGNAGAGKPENGGGEMKDIVRNVEIWHNGEVRTLNNKGCVFSYRNSVFKDPKSDLFGSIILSATISLGKTLNKAQSVKKTLEMLAYRTKTQPRIASCGCIFKNPSISGARQSAGRLIEIAGCKGMKIGGAKVSEAHGNFIVNEGGATAVEIKELIQKVKEKVFEKFNVNLEEEIRII